MTARGGAPTTLMSPLRPGVLATALLLCTGALTGCYTRAHAPGHASRASMTRVPLPAIKPQLCLGGACDLEAPLGPIRFSAVQFQSLNGKRSETSFRVAYQTARATCSGPVARPDGLPPLPFACTIGASDDLPVTLRLATGCLVAALEPTQLLGNEPPLRLETDVVGLGGSRFPGNEIALLGPEGVRAFATSQSTFDMTLFVRPGATLSASQTLAVVALRAFFELEGKPAECIRAQP